MTNKDMFKGTTYQKFIRRAGRWQTLQKFSHTTSRVYINNELIKTKMQGKCYKIYLQDSVIRKSNKI